MAVQTFEIYGEKLTIRQMSEKYDMQRDKLRHRIVKGGMTPEEAVSFRERVNKNKPRKVTYKGEEYTIKQLAERFGLKENTLAVRILRGRSIEEALGFIGRGGKKLIYLTYNGQTKEIGDWANELGVQRATIARQHKSGWSVEKILTKIEK